MKYPAIAALVWLLLLTAGQPTTVEGSEGYTIVVHPNILVSHDPSAPRNESWVAADPTNPLRLVGAVTTMRDSDIEKSRFDSIHASVDGGNTWFEVDLPEVLASGSGDPQVAFGPDGTAYFMTLTLTKPYRGIVYRSKDLHHWFGPAPLTTIDHERMVADLTQNASRGAVYVAAEGDSPVRPWPLPRNSAVLVFRSSDGGKSFGPPVVAATNNLPASDRLRGGGDAVEGTLVLHDGSLVIGITRYPATGAGNGVRYRLVTIASRDGGKTFGPEHVVSRPMMSGDISVDMTKYWQKSEFAVDGSDGRYRDRLYAVWNDVSSGTAQVWLAASADRGVTWSAPVNVDGAWKHGDGDNQMNVAVNRDGTVGVVFYHVSKGLGRQFDVYFSASTDGGRSFMRPVRISTATSFPFSGGNLRLMPTDRIETPDAVAAVLENGLSWGNGGHYIGIATSPDGAFHPLWTDARSGMFQLYTARIDVAHAVSLGTATSASSVQSLNRDVRLVLDPVEYDAASHVMTFPVRIQNVSTGTIAGPVTLTLVAPGKGANSATAHNFSVVSSQNQKLGYGAMMSYGHALGTLNRLAPGEVSDAVYWKLKLDHPETWAIAQPAFDVRGAVANP